MYSYQLDHVDSTASLMLVADLIASLIYIDTITPKFAKDLGRATGLRHCLLVGGDSMEEQFQVVRAL